MEQYKIPHGAGIGHVHLSPFAIRPGAIWEEPCAASSTPLEALLEEAR